jgi:hypothetical protein
MYVKINTQLPASFRHLTPNAFALDAGYNDTEKLYKFIPCEMAFDCPDEVEDHRIVAKSRKLQLEFR